MDVYPQVVTGYRMWSRTQAGREPALQALWHGDPWKPGVNYSSCSEHKAPGKHCQCGFNMFHSLSRLFAYRRLVNTKKKRVIVGAVAGRGKTQVHWDGCRVEEAQIIALLRPGTETKISRFLHRLRRRNVEVENLARAYKVSIFDSPKQLQRYVESFQGTAPDDLRQQVFDPERYELEQVLGAKANQIIIGNSAHRIVIGIVVAATVLSWWALVALLLLAP